jgi:hypothetical protein
MGSSCSSASGSTVASLYVNKMVEMRESATDDGVVMSQELSSDYVEYCARDLKADDACCTLFTGGWRFDGCSCQNHDIMAQMAQFVYVCVHRRASAHEVKNYIACSLKPAFRYSGTFSMALVLSPINSDEIDLGVRLSLEPSGLIPELVAIVLLYNNSGISVCKGIFTSDHLSAIKTSSHTDDHCLRIPTNFDLNDSIICTLSLRYIPATNNNCVCRIVPFLLL